MSTNYSIGPGVVIKKRKNPTRKKIEKRYEFEAVEGGSIDDFKGDYRMYEHESTEVISDTDSEITVEWVMNNGSEYTATYTIQ